MLSLFQTADEPDICLGYGVSKPVHVRREKLLRWHLSYLVALGCILYGCLSYFVTLGRILYRCLCSVAFASGGSCLFLRWFPSRSTGDDHRHHATFHYW